LCSPKDKMLYGLQLDRQFSWHAIKDQTDN